MSPRRKRLRVRSKAALYAECVDDPTYGELLYETFGPRVIGFQISRHGDGMNFQRRPVRHGAIPVHTAGRSYLLELYVPCCSLIRSELWMDQPPDALTSSWGLRPRFARAGSSTVGR